MTGTAPRDGGLDFTERYKDRKRGLRADVSTNLREAIVGLLMDWPALAHALKKLPAARFVRRADQ
jgi:hypothetical protein